MGKIPDDDDELPPLWEEAHVRVNGPVLAKRRIERGMNETELATAAKCNRKTIENYEKSRRAAVSILVRIAKTLGVTDYRDLCQHPAMSPADPSPSPPLADEADVSVVCGNISAADIQDRSETELLRQIALNLKKVLSGNRKVSVIAFYVSSIVVTLRLHKQDAIALTTAFVKGDIDPSITEIKLHQYGERIASNPQYQILLDLFMSKQFWMLCPPIAITVWINRLFSYIATRMLPGNPPAGGDKGAAVHDKDTDTLTLRRGHANGSEVSASK